MTHILILTALILTACNQSLPPEDPTQLSDMDDKQGITVCYSDGRRFWCERKFKSDD